MFAAAYPSLMDNTVLHCLLPWLQQTLGFMCVPSPTDAPPRILSGTERGPMCEYNLLVGGDWFLLVHESMLTVVQTNKLQTQQRRPKGK